MELGVLEHACSTQTRRVESQAPRPADRVRHTGERLPRYLRGWRISLLVRRNRRLNASAPAWRPQKHVGPGHSSVHATLFLGSGLLFVAMLFVLSAAAHGLPASAYTAQDSSQLQLVLRLLSSYCTRMAAVFTMATTSIGSGLGLFPRWLAWLGYLVAVVLLFVSVPWAELTFPVWVLAISSFIFQASPDRQSAPTSIS